MANFCSCGSLMIDDHCTNKNCAFKVNTTGTKIVRQKKEKKVKDESKPKKATKTKRASKCITYNLNEEKNLEQEEEEEQNQDLTQDLDQNLDQNLAPEQESN